MKTILVIVDDAMVGGFIVHMIAHRTHHLPILVLGGSEALQVTFEIKPDLFLFDYLLPTTNNIDLYDYLHQQSKLKDVPAIMVGNLSSQKKVLQALEERQIAYTADIFPIPAFLQLLEDVMDANEIKKKS